jgi:hypothetical protein
MKRFTWLAVIVGWAISQVFIYIARNLVVFMAYGSNVQGFRLAAYASAWVIAPLGSLLGGLAAARISRDRTVIYGMAVGSLALLGELARILTLGVSLYPILIFSWLVLPIAGALGGWLGGLGLKKSDTLEATLPGWLRGAVTSMGAFLVFGGLLLLFSVKNESGFVYVDGSTTIGYITQAVLLLGYLAIAIFRSSNAWLSEYTDLVFMLVVSGLPWAVCGALFATGHKRWAYFAVTIIILGSAIPGVLFWLIAKGLSEGPSLPVR